jgi:xanthine/uracil permease
MNPLLVHLVVVHVPVVGLLFAAATAVAAAVWDDRRLLILALLFSGICVAGGVIAYVSGPQAYDVLKEHLDPEAIAVADDHAVLGKAGFATVVLIGIGLAQIVIRWAGGTPPPRWTGWALATTLALTAILFAVTAHHGGGIRRPESRNLLKYAEPG